MSRIRRPAFAATRNPNEEEESLLHLGPSASRDELGDWGEASEMKIPERGHIQLVAGLKLGGLKSVAGSCRSLRPHVKLTVAVSETCLRLMELPRKSVATEFLGKLVTFLKPTGPRCPTKVSPNKKRESEEEEEEFDEEGNWIEVATFPHYPLSTPLATPQYASRYASQYASVVLHCLWLHSNFSLSLSLAVTHCHSRPQDIFSY